MRHTAQPMPLGQRVHPNLADHPKRQGDVGRRTLTLNGVPTGQKLMSRPLLLAFRYLMFVRNLFSSTRDLNQVLRSADCNFLVSTTKQLQCVGVCAIQASKG